MDSYTVVLSPSSMWTRVLVRRGSEHLLRAALPPPWQVWHPRAAATFLEGLALWLDATLPVALSVDAAQVDACFNLVDEHGAGVQSAFYRVELVEREGRRRRGARIQGVGGFADLRQLRLVTDGEG